MCVNLESGQIMEFFGEPVQSPSIFQTPRVHTPLVANQRLSSTTILQNYEHIESFEFGEHEIDSGTKRSDFFEENLILPIYNVNLVN